MSFLPPTFVPHILMVIANAGAGASFLPAKDTTLAAFRLDFETNNFFWLQARSTPI
jgi:hypothetical protein